ncbi:MAG: Hpt domain-containing protein, partial [Ramlibacter sp.]
AILYLEAAFEDLDPTDSQLAARTARLAQRLGNVRQGVPPEALEPWMEELYRRVSDRQTMGSVVGELRSTLGELEKLLDNFFRNPKDKKPLGDAPGHLSQMRGVLSVLGLDQAAQAVLRMREAVEEILVTEVDEEKARAAGTFDKLGNNLGALGFLIDMLNYQPALAKKLFLYDDSTGELRPLMGRTGHTLGEADAGVSVNEDMLSQEVMSVVSEAADSGMGQLTARLDTLATHAVLADQPGMAQSARDAAAAVSAQDSGATAAALSDLAAAVQPAPTAAPTAAEEDFEEDDLRDIFLEEAREVVQNATVALATLAANPSDVGELTTLRRAFHTLKGSSRMVGLNEFGEAAWSLEQVLNTWLADQKPVTEALRSLSGDAVRGFGRWVEDIARGTDGDWKAGLFRTAADALRTENRLVSLALPESQAGAAEPDANPADEPSAESFDFSVAESVAEMQLPVADATPTRAPVPVFQPIATVAFEAPIAKPPVAPPPVEIAAFQSTQILRVEPLDEPEIPPVVMGEFNFELPSASRDPQAPVEIEGIDFASLSAVSGPAAEPPAAEARPPDVFVDFDAPSSAGMDVSFTELPAESEEIPFELPDFAAPAPAVAAAPVEAHQPEMAADVFELPEPEPEDLTEAAGTADAADEQVKVIGSLRIGIPLYNVYLNEADEWSRRLVTEVSEWCLELNHRVPDSTVGLAHALAGSSATVGFHTLSDIARSLENALEHTQRLAFGTPEHGKAFTDAAEEIRRLLHQFAAGFLKDADPGVTLALQALKDLDVPQREDLRDEESLSGFGDLAPTPAIVAAPVAAPAEAVAPQPVATPAPVPVQIPVQPVFAAQPPVARPVQRVQSTRDDDDDDIDITDAIDLDLFPIFEEEAVELMPQLGGALRQWAARSDNRGARDEVLRALHTLKGSARLAGALRLGELAHRMESEIEYLGSENVQAGDIEPLLHRFDAMQANFDKLRETGGLTPGVPEPAVQAPVMQEQPVPATPADAAPAGRRSLVAMPVTSTVAPIRQAANQAVRVRSQLLDRLVNQAGEVMITRSRLENELKQLRGSLGDLTGNLDRLRAQLRDIELQAESQMQSRLAQAKDSA